MGLICIAIPQISQGSMSLIVVRWCKHNLLRLGLVPFQRHIEIVTENIQLYLPSLHFSQLAIRNLNILIIPLITCVHQARGFFCPDGREAK